MKIEFDPMNADECAAVARMIGTPVIVQEVPANDDAPVADSTPVIQRPHAPVRDADGGAALDSRGLPWDARIHSGTRARIADGSWRQKRNLDPAVLSVVEAELRATLAAVPPATPPTLPEPVVHAVTPPGIGEHSAEPTRQLFTGADIQPPVAPVVTPPAVMVHPQNPAFVSYDNGATWIAAPQPAPVAPVVPVVAAPAPVAAMTFPEFMAKLATMTTTGKTDAVRIAHALAEVGLQSAPQLAIRTELIGTVAARLDQLASM